MFGDYLVMRFDGNFKLDTMTSNKVKDYLALTSEYSNEVFDNLNDNQLDRFYESLHCPIE